MISRPASEPYARRQILAFGAALIAGRVAAACSSASTSDSSTNAGSDGGSPSGAADASTSDASLGSADDASTLTEVDAAETGWATGGTASMTGKAGYPNPFAGATTPSSCTVSCALTQGPCYSSQSVEIQDISYGYDGLPTRIYLQILDETCKPVSGAVVDVWHVGPTGKYSGDDSVNEDIAFCTGSDSDFTSHLYFRGKQTTDANGVVFFDTCFPGWYSSRTIHVHMTISVGGTAFVTTQLGFEDALDDAIVATQPLYKDRGSRDTSNATDTVLPATDLDLYLFDTAKMSDGAMLAWKTIILRSAVSESICSPAGAKSSGGGGGEGGMGGGGPGGEGGPGGAPPGLDGG